MRRKAGVRRVDSLPASGVGGWLLAGVGLTCLVGCSGGGPYDIVEVSGTVKYDDGSLIPAESILLRFEPQAASLDAKTHPRKGLTRVNVADGSFESVTTHKHGDGIVAGKHKVLIFPTTKDGKPAKLIPDEYNDPATTPLEVDTDNPVLELRVKKPGQ
jgi:hypothetical protein